jgi:hypothetical protein
MYQHVFNHHYHSIFFIEYCLLDNFQFQQQNVTFKHSLLHFQAKCLSSSEAGTGFLLTPNFFSQLFYYLSVVSFWFHSDLEINEHGFKHF